jgi:hypothetical protein
MNRFLNWFTGRRVTRPAFTNRPRPFRPQVEQLDERLVPSGFGSAISIQHNWGLFGNWTERDWFTVDQATGHVVEFSGTSRRDLGGPGYIEALSASVDPNGGFGEVFALRSLGGYNGVGLLWLCDSGGNWHSLGGKYTSISATTDGHVYAVTENNTGVRYLDSSGNGMDLGTPTTGGLYGAGGAGTGGTIITASVNWFGANEVFVIGNDAAIYVYNAHASGQWRLVDNRAFFTSLSATPNDTVFAVSGDGRLFQETEHYRVGKLGGLGGYYYWTGQDISGGMTFSDVSADIDASGHDEAYAMQPMTDDAGDVIGYSTIYVYDEGTLTLKASSEFASTLVDFAPAGGGYYYEVAWLGIQGFGGHNEGYMVDPYGNATDLGPSLD